MHATKPLPQQNSLSTLSAQFCVCDSLEFSKGNNIFFSFDLRKLIKPFTQTDDPVNNYICCIWLFRQNVSKNYFPNYKDQFYLAEMNEPNKF